MSNASEAIDVQLSLETCDLTLTKPAVMKASSEVSDRFAMCQGLVSTFGTVVLLTTARCHSRIASDHER